MKTITTQVGLHCHTAVIFRRLAVFSFLAVTTLAEAVKPNYGGIFSAVMHDSGNFLAVGGFPFFGGNDLSASGETKIWRYFFGGNAIRRYNFLAVRGFSFTGGNELQFKLGGNCGA